VARQRHTGVPGTPTEKEQFYARLLEEQAQSGVSQRELARRRRLPPTRLSWWKHEIARRQRARAGGSKQGGSTPALLPVKIVPAVSRLGQEPRPAPCAEERFEVRLAGSGHTVRVPGDFDPRLLALVVHTLEVVPC